MVKNRESINSALLPEAVFFDLDGTLVDSAPDLTAALNTTLKTLELGSVDEQEVAQWIGNGVDKLLHRALSKSMNGVASGDDFWRMRNIFYRNYEKQSGHLSKLYPNVKKVLDKFKKNNILVACITNKNRQFTLPLIENLGLEKCFDVIVCGDDLSNKKPHPEPLLYAASKLNVSAKSCMMVGDSKSDIVAANEARIPVIAVDYGYSQGVNLKTLNVDAFVSDLIDIEKYFNENVLKQCV